MNTTTLQDPRPASFGLSSARRRERGVGRGEDRPGAPSQTPRARSSRPRSFARDQRRRFPSRKRASLRRRDRGGVATATSLAPRRTRPRTRHAYDLAALGHRGRRSIRTPLVCTANAATRALFRFRRHDPFPKNAAAVARRLRTSRGARPHTPAAASSRRFIAVAERGGPAHSVPERGDARAAFQRRRERRERRRGRRLFLVRLMARLVPRRRDIRNA